MSWIFLFWGEIRALYFRRTMNLPLPHLSSDDLRKVLYFDVREAGAWQSGQKLLSTTRQRCSKGIAILLDRNSDAECLSGTHF